MAENILGRRAEDKNVISIEERINKVLTIDPSQAETLSKTDLASLFKDAYNLLGEAKDENSALRQESQNYLAQINQMQDYINKDVDSSKTGLPRSLQWLYANILSNIGRSKADPRYNFTVAFIDVDHFKQINDTYGHIFGDKVLCSVAQSIKSALRDDDALIRYASNSDEFVGLIANSDGERAKKVLERISQTVKERSLNEGKARLEEMIKDGLLNKSAPLYQGSTVSIGAVVYPNILLKDDPEYIVEFVDGKLKESKGAGKNRMIII